MQNCARSIILLLCTAASFGFIYTSSNYLCSLRNSVFHFYADWELNIPFVQWTILIYLSAYFSFLIPLIYLSYDQQKKLAKTIILSSLIGATFFLLFPTTLGFERNISETSTFRFLYQTLWSLDRPYTLVPSFHVSMCYILIIPAAKIVDSKSTQVIFITWLFLISLSTVTTHQHHLVDVPTGALLGHISLKMFFWRNNEPEGNIK